MKNNFTAVLLFSAITNFVATDVSAQQTVGLFSHTAGSYDNGYVLFAPISYTTTYLIDKCGNEVHSWPSQYKPGQAVYILPDGTLLRTALDTSNANFVTGGEGGFIEKIDWNGNVLWHYAVSDSMQRQHHDVEALPDGNVLVISWEKKTRAEAIAAGRDTTMIGTDLWPDKILELQPVGSSQANIVWQWHAWDHLVQDFDSTKANYGVVAAHPELINLNYTSGPNPGAEDWMHTNAISYNAALDEIIMSIHNFSEVWIIDHSTTTAEAASHSGGNRGKGGDLLYRWGNPRTYDMGTTNDQVLFGQHDAEWIPAGYPDAGKVMVFNNGNGRPGGPSAHYSSVDIFTTPVDSAGNYSNAVMPYLPLTEDWTYTAPTPTDFYAQNISSGQMLPNGNVLICNGPAGSFFEVDSLKNEVWNYVSPVGNNGPVAQYSTPVQPMVFRAKLYLSSYSGFASHNLAGGTPIELNPLVYNCNLDTVSGINEHLSQSPAVSVFPDPASGIVHIKSEAPVKEIRLYDVNGKIVETAEHVAVLDVQALSAGIYFAAITTTKGTEYRKVVVEHN